MIDPKPTASHFINGAYIEDKTGTPIDVIYPATGEVIGRVHSATPQILQAALAAAKAAQPIWAAMTGTERGRILRRAADMMRAHNRSLSELETYDTGKPLQETLVADATSAADALEYFGGLAGSLTGSICSLVRILSIRYENRSGSALALGLGTTPRKLPPGRLRQL